MKFIGAPIVCERTRSIATGTYFAHAKAPRIIRNSRRIDFRELLLQAGTSPLDLNSRRFFEYFTKVMATTAPFSLLRRLL
jgi:hypothetical protein